ncbi:MAG TPA: hypothetical protein VFJ02_00505 [Vicinamibacterales bacterium]|nr:hypothetical protein [Vicinamibacterales bacterium]
MVETIKKTALGVDENMAGALAYALGWITGAALLLLEHENRYARFHAMQSVVVFGTLSVLWFVGPAIPFFGWVLSFLIIPPLSAGLWLFLLYKAYTGQRFKLPIVGEFAEQHS